MFFQLAKQGMHTIKFSKKLICTHFLFVGKVALNQAQDNSIDII